VNTNWRLLAILVLSIFTASVLLTPISNFITKSMGVSIVGDSYLLIEVYNTIIGTIAIPSFIAESVRPYLGVTITGPFMGIVIHQLFQIVIQCLRTLAIVYIWKMSSPSTPIEKEKNV
jgi:hypothetical protein